MPTIPLRHGPVYYELEGPGDGPLVVLVHGLATPSYIWDPTFPVLVEAGYRALRFDLYGRGRSAKPRLRYTLELFVAQLQELLAALELDGPLRVIGLSMGGAIATTFTAGQTHEVVALGLVSPAGLAQRLPLKAHLARLPGFGDFLFALIGHQVLRRGIHQNFYRPERFPDFAAKFTPQLKDRGYLPAILSTIRHTNLFGLSEQYAAVGRLGLPVLLIWGRADTIVPFANSARVQELIPQCALLAVAEAGHVAHYERPEVVHPRLLEFLAQTKKSVP